MRLKLMIYAYECWLRLVRRNIVQWLNEPVTYEDIGDCSGLLCTTNLVSKKPVYCVFLISYIYKNNECFVCKR